MASYTEIGTYDEYNERMAKSVLDKLFFLDKIDAHLYVDFGCADGTLFKYMMPFVVDSVPTLLGYDTDANMCKIAEQRFLKSFPPGSIGNTKVYFTSEWKNVEDMAKDGRNSDQKTCLILNSVIHEVYNYSDRRAIDKFWFDVFRNNFDYIVIRDMIPSESIDRVSDINDVAKVLRKFRNNKALRDFESIWGGIQSNKNLLHFLLKYKFVTPNWEREVKENYIPLYHEDLLAMLPTEYDIMYHEHYPLPYIKREVRNDFGIELKDATHLKLILEKR